jgi:steroid 5-alpha reductase family enzyme
MTLNAFDQSVTIALAAFLIMFVLWLVQIRTRDAGVVDVGWAASLGLSAIFCAVSGEGEPMRRLFVGVMGGIWGLRLALHLLLDRVLRGPEDGRYQMMREKFGPRINAVLLPFFLAQGVLVLLLSVPFILASRSHAPAPSALDWSALALWIGAFLGESVADAQLKAFKRSTTDRGRVCDVGLWRYSRHPNYFFEWLMWVAYAILATSAPFGWIAWSAPALMLVFILKLTGIPPTEARALRSRGDAYRRYQQTTSAYIPWFPRALPPNSKEQPR